MEARYVTIIGVGSALLAIVVYDSVMAAVNDRATISWITAQWALRHTISVFCVGMALGIIIGHLFWYQNPMGKP
jgi:uncharacterized membrane protein